MSSQRWWLDSGCLRSVWLHSRSLHSGGLHSGCLHSGCLRSAGGLTAVSRASGGRAQRWPPHGLSLASQRVLPSQQQQPSRIWLHSGWLRGVGGSTAVVLTASGFKRTSFIAGVFRPSCFMESGTFTAAGFTAVCFSLVGFSALVAYRGCLLSVWFHSGCPYLWELSSSGATLNLIGTHLICVSRRSARMGIN